MLRLSKGRLGFFSALFVVLPLVVLIVVGVLVLVFRQRSADVAFGVLILSFCAALIAGAILLVIALKRTADESALQADFLSKVSHDFRTPLTSIRMFVETLRDNRLSDTAQRDRVLTLLTQETERLLTLIDRLLELSRLEAGRIRYDKQPLNPAELVRRVADRFLPRLLAGGRLDLHIAENLPSIHADADAVAEILQNLIDNAFKYTGAEKCIDIEAFADEGELVLAVSDNGPGVARTEHRRVFERFYRADDRLSRVTEGSGLGLAIARHLVQDHGGKIQIDDKFKGGARFVVRLPLLH